MILVKKINSLPKWSKNDNNRWADFIELSCLNNQDNFITIDDILDHFTDERPEETDRGSIDHSPEYDKLRSKVNDYFIYINFRAETLGKYYPFIVSENSIKLKDRITKYNEFYFFLLFSSNLAFFDESTRFILAHAFEDMSCDILRLISSPLATTHVFGTSRDTGGGNYKGNLGKRISSLAKNINSTTTKSFDDDKLFNAPGGDGGLDLVSYIPVDNMPFIPISFAQCACSYNEWEIKQASIRYDIWNQRIENMSPYLQFTFVPFYYRHADGSFENFTNIITCLYDRLRIFRVIRRTIIKKFQKHRIYCIVKEILKEFYVSNIVK